MFYIWMYKAVCDYSVCGRPLVGVCAVYNQLADSPMYLYVMNVYVCLLALGNVL